MTVTHLARAQYQIGERVWSPPLIGTYFSLQNTNWPPLPGLPPAAVQCPVYFLGTIDGIALFSFDDSGVDYESELSPSEGPGSPTSNPPSFGSGDLWLEILAATNNQAFLRLHNVTTNAYQLQSKLNLEDPFWTPGQIVQRQSDGDIDFDPVPTTNNPHMFFRAQLGHDIVFVEPDPDNPKACEPKVANNDPGIVGGFRVTRLPGTANVNIRYTMGGIATAGDDYTNPPGSVFIGSADAVNSVFVDPIEDNLVEFTETVTLTLRPGTNYLIDPDKAQATIFLFDNPFEPVVALNHPAGIDYHAPSNALIVSVAEVHGASFNFAMISTNIIVTNTTTITNVVVTNWSGISGLDDEIKLATVKVTTNGFTNGDMYFHNGDPGGIGFLSADGIVSNLNWITLPGETNNLRGSLYVDRSGTFGGDLIAVSGDQQSVIGGSMGVWRINSDRQSTNVARISCRHLEGAVTLTNDASQWGPWAGRIITGDELGTDTNGVPSGRVFAIQPSGSVTNFELQIEPEDFDIIPPNQDLYCLDGQLGVMLKVSKSYFTNFVGDLLVMQEGITDILHPPSLFIVHWDTSTTNFVTTNLPYFKPLAGFEHATFAPITFPTVTNFQMLPQ